MYEIDVAASASSYRVIIERGSWPTAVRQADFLVVDDYFRGLLDESDRDRAVFIEASEQGKSLATCESVLDQLHQLGARRGATIAAVGGGVVQDVTTLAASIYMRGLPWVYVPTTAMAMADSCIGGKSSINLGRVKNLVGNVYPPSAVYVDSEFAVSLPTPDRVAGLAEAVKICFARGAEAFGEYLAVGVTGRTFGEVDATDELIRCALSAKKWFIEVDEFDRKERQLLNFGHTFAHALEPAVEFSIPHGVAVALGVLAALRHPLSVQDTATRELQDYCGHLLGEVPEAVLTARNRFDEATFGAAIASDKKSTNAEIRFVLPSGGASLSLVGVPRSPAAVADAVTAMTRVLEECTS